MDLTPVGVRGKRRAKGQPSLAAGPPMKKRAKIDAGSSPSKKPCLITSMLPKEILEQIFWLSQNVNFPLASPLIGRMLSNSSLMQTIFHGFVESWDAFLDGYRCTITRDLRQIPGDPTFQTDILAQRWCTAELLLGAQKQWLRDWNKRRPQELLQWIHDAHQLTNPLDIDPENGSRDIVGLRPSLTYAYGLLSQPGVNDELQFVDMTCVEIYAKWRGIHASTNIPDYLLCGKWTEDNMKKLLWLVQAGARLAEHQTWEITRFGLRHVITDDPDEPKIVALKLLQHLGAWMHWPAHIRDEELDIWMRAWKSLKNLTRNENGDNEANAEIVDGGDWDYARSL
ncbi:hypothetical protein F4777DRAFT_573172 [Nemania sp. FL0916]|nr:hypothetical protein F4777DRAFT_573172 [Nemania sp. FL0916]